MFNSCKLSRHGTDVISDPTTYTSIAGALQYVTLTWINIAFNVNKACQFKAQPLDSYWRAVKRILGYLSGTTDHGLILIPETSVQHLSLKACSDSDWASDPDDKRSTSGLCFYLGTDLVSWSSRNSP